MPLLLSPANTNGGCDDSGGDYVGKLCCVSRPVVFCSPIANLPDVVTKAVTRRTKVARSKERERGKKN